MKCRRAGAMLASGLASVAGLSAASRADISFPSFQSVDGLMLVGQAARSGSSLRLTPSDAQVVGAAWYQAQQQVATGFDTTFTFQLSQINGGADGFTFAIQAFDAQAIGEPGCRMAYDGMPNSVVVEFDTYANGPCKAGDVNDPDGNHISIHTRGVDPNSATEAASIGRTSAIPNIKDGNAHAVRITYSQAAGLMRVYFDDLDNPVLEAAIDLAGTLDLNSGEAWVGFTASCGGATEAHDILSWSFTEGAGGPPPTDNHRPATPTITEPFFDGRIVNPADVHMETGPFVDQDAPPQTHVCSDWEIWTVNPPERVWQSSCIGGVERVHVHLGDGIFQGSYAGRRDLIADTDYRLRTRHRDSSGDPVTEWSFWAQRLFRTAPPGSDTPLLAEDIAVPPSPLWVADSGSPIELPAGGTPASLTIGSAAGETLLVISGDPGPGNMLTDSPELPEHINMRLHFQAGSTALDLPASTFRFLDAHCDYRTLFLPEIHVAANGEAFYWVAVSGTTYVGAGDQTDPVLAVVARASSTTWAAEQEGFEVERFATGFQLPVNIAFVPNPGPNPEDPFFYVTELYGSIKLVTRSGQVSTYASGLLNFNPTGDFPGSGEQGVTGIVVDPASGDLFVTMLYSSTPGVEAAPHYPKVVRFHSSDGGHTAATQTTILDMNGETQGQSHQISNISIGPDGKLYVHMGDGFNSSTGQNLGSFRGKILRMNLDGSAPADNPLYNGAPIGPRDYVYAYGLRNPFGGAWRDSDNFHYEVENGPSVDRWVRVVPGRNYLYDGSDQSMQNFAIYNWNPASGPVNMAIIQPGTFGGSGFPAAKFDHVFISESGPTYGQGANFAKRISEFVIDQDGALVTGPTTLVQYVGTGRGTAVGLAAGPDGLYFTDLYKDLDTSGPTDVGANVWRIRYVPTTDCNDNGAPDWCDIAKGASQDANENGIPDECEFCPSDWNHSGTINSQDFFDFLNAFFMNNADFNSDGQTNSQDFFDFLTAFFDGC